MRKWISEFKQFALAGNMVDMAVGIMIGAAFGTVVQSLVNDVMMPLISGVIKTPDFKNMFIVLSNPTGQTFTSIEAARDAGAAVLGIGLFINALIAFLIVAVVLFMIVKGINSMRRKQAATEQVAPAAPTPQEKLLEEIRDILRERTVV